VDGYAASHRAGGDIQDRIKECHLDLFADRTPADSDGIFVFKTEDHGGVRPWGFGNDIRPVLAGPNAQDNK
jgi:hypothetical protein